MIGFTIVRGDFKDTYWELKNEILSSGFYNKKEIPIKEVTNLTQTEKIGKDLYIEFELGTSQKFTAKMREKDYKKVYDKFISVGNNPQESKLPIQTKSQGVIWSGVGLFVILALASVGNDGSNSGSSKSKDWSDEDAIVYCQMALEDSAKYGARFPFGTNKTASRYSNNKNKFKVVMGAEIKNAYGTWGKRTVSCVVNGTRVEKLVIDGSVIWGN